MKTRIVPLFVMALFAWTMASAQETVLKTDRQTYAPKDQIIVEFSGLPGNQTDWITVVDASWDDTAYGGQWSYTKGQRSGAMKFIAGDPGSYEVRLYFNDPKRGKIVHARAAFTVGGSMPGLMSNNRTASTTSSVQSNGMLAAGKPPLTQEMVNQLRAFFEWALDISLTPTQQSQLKNALVNVWKKNDRGEIESTITTVQMQAQLAQSTPDARTRARNQVQAALLKSLHADSNDAISRMLLTAYESAHGQAATLTDQPTSSPPESNQPRISAGGLSGVWMGFKQLQLLGNYAPDARWMTFFDDGQALDNIPRAGLEGFDRNASKANGAERPYWGTYSYRDGAGVFKKLNGGLDTRIKLEKPGQIKLDDFYSYYRCPDVGGLRLEGAWAGYGDPDDPRWRSVPIGQRQVFRFGSDGRFSDEGVFATLLTAEGGSSANGPGSGTYEIRSFSLILHYADGRLKKVAITGLLSANPATQNSILFIGRARFNKMK